MFAVILLKITYKAKVFNNLVIIFTNLCVYVLNYFLFLAHKNDELLCILFYNLPLAF